MFATKYFWIAQINFKTSLAYIFDIIGSSAFIAIIIFVFINLWSVIYADRTLVFGLTLPMMIWYLVFTETMVTSTGKLVQEIGEEVKKGEIANYLNKPYHYLAYKYSKTLGSTIFSFLITLAIAGTIAFIFVGPIQINPMHIPFIAIAALLGLAIYFIMSALLGIFAFWIEDAKAIEFIYSKILFTIGGMLAPLEIWPQFIADVSKLLPFSLTAYYPAKLFVAFSFDIFINVIILEIFWITVLVGITLLLFNIFSKKISINGG